MLIKQPDNARHRSSSRMLAFVHNVGSVSNTEGIENEVEKLWTSTLMRDVVIIYATQPITVDLDPLHLDSIDKIAYEDFCTINMRIYRKSSFLIRTFNIS